jgi:ribonuclease P protein subunit RPR2
VNYNLLRFCLLALAFCMAKVKASKGAAGITNKALHSRVSFLYQAAAYLATRAPQTFENMSSTDCTGPHQDDGRVPNMTPPNGVKLPALALSRLFISDLRCVSLKTQTRLSPAMKHSICKGCNTMLIDGSTCESRIENKSKGGRKSWADILVRKCKGCGYERRFPVEVKRQARRPHRSSNATDRNLS